MYKTTRNVTLLSVGLGVSALVGWLFLREAKRSPQAEVVVKSHLPETDALAEIPLPLEDTDLEATSPGEDDFTEIRGIGPSYAEALRAIGITRFEQLARQTPEELAERLSQHVKLGAQRIQESNWIGQAAQKARR
jgi:predicted flap endonuclease-1-like 5' DNA nuclease